jgi:outer membrane protein assembly factor BamB
MLAADGAAFLLVQSGNPAKEQEIRAVGLTDGKQRWSVPHTALGPEPTLHLICAGQGVLAVARVRAKAISVLSAADGKVLWEIKATDNFFTPIVEGLLWHGNQKYDPKTGEPKGKLPSGIHSPVCTPAAVVNNIVTASRGCQYIEFPAAVDGQPKPARFIAYGGARGGCIEGAVPACGMFYTSQNNCRCAPGQVQGFVAFGPSGDAPAQADFEQSRPFEKGPAFGQVKPSAPGGDDWPMFRRDAARSGAAKSKLPQELKVLWQQEACRPADGPMADAWKARMVSCLTAPVTAGGLVFSAAIDGGQVVAMDAASGKVLWRFTAGGRIDSPPTIHQGLCTFGCRDGWIYAVRAQDGVLAWRTRVAPKDRRMVAFGQVESVWPAIGTVLVHDNILYATAGHTTESDGGIALCAYEPQTGRQLWGSSVGPGPVRVNDMLAVADGKLAMHHIRIDPQSGKHEIAKDVRSEAYDGAMDGTWTRLGNRRSGNLTFGKVKAEMLAWNDATVFGYEGHPRSVFAVPREKTAYDATAKDKDKIDPKDYKWRVSLPGGYQAEAMVLTQDAVLLAGRVWDPKAEKASGFLWGVSIEDGKKSLELPLDAPPCFQGLAVSSGNVYLTLENGQVVCLGK